MDKFFPNSSGRIGDDSHFSAGLCFFPVRIGGGGAHVVPRIARTSILSDDDVLDLVAQTGFGCSFLRVV